MSDELVKQLRYVAKVFRDYDEFAPEDIRLAGTLPDEAAARLAEVERERDRFRAEVRRLTEGWQIQHNRAEAAEARAERLEAAGNRLSIAAQTTGGTAGRDEGLCAAIDGWAAALQQEGGE